MAKAWWTHGEGFTVFSQGICFNFSPSLTADARIEFYLMKLPMCFLREFQSKRVPKDYPILFTVVSANTIERQ